MLHEVQHLILDGMALSSIQLLSSGFSHVTHLYLQRNSITDISPLSSMVNLTDTTQPLPTRSLLPYPTPLSHPPPPSSPASHRYR